MALTVYLTSLLLSKQSAEARHRGFAYTWSCCVAHTGLEPVTLLLQSPKAPLLTEYSFVTELRDSSYLTESRDPFLSPTFTCINVSVPFMSKHGCVKRGFQFGAVGGWGGGGWG